MIRARYGDGLTQSFVSASGFEFCFRSVCSASSQSVALLIHIAADGNILSSRSGEG